MKSTTTISPDGTHQLTLLEIFSWLRVSWGKSWSADEQLSSLTAGLFMYQKGIQITLVLCP